MTQLTIKGKPNCWGADIWPRTGGSMQINSTSYKPSIFKQNFSQYSTHTSQQ